MANLSGNSSKNIIQFLESDFAKNINPQSRDFENCLIDILSKCSEDGELINKLLSLCEITQFPQRVLEQALLKAAREDYCIEPILALPGIEQIEDSMFAGKQLSPEGESFMVSA